MLMLWHVYYMPSECILLVVVSVCCRMPTPAHASMFAAGMFYTLICFFATIAPCILELMQIRAKTRKKYIGLVPTYYAAIRLDLHNPNPEL